jgi:predicted MFS family arabinose efflux permease
MPLLLWCCGMGLAIAIGGALGGSFVQEHGRKVLPLVIVLTIVTGLLLGWGLNGEYNLMHASTEVQ